MNLEFATSSRVIFGRDELNRIGELAGSLGARALLVTGRASMKESGALKRIDNLLTQQMVSASAVSIEREPTVSMIDRLVDEARSYNPEFIIAIGGGSVMDAGKAIGCLLTNGGSAQDYLAGDQPARVVSKRSTPVIAIPTTSGSGAEVTKNAVLLSERDQCKRSMRSELIRPEIALVDPNLAMTMPTETTAATGVDAQTQLIESFTSRRAGILTDGLSREGLALIAAALEEAFFHPDDVDVRESMAMASLLGGMTLDNVGLGAVHGLASPLGGMFEIPHGVICANLLPEITEANLEAIGKDKSLGKAMARYQEIARILSGDPEGKVSRLVTTLRLQRRTLRIPPLRSFGVREEHISAILANCRGGSMDTNPVYLEDVVLRDVLRTVIAAEGPSD